VCEKHINKETKYKTNNYRVHGVSTPRNGLPATLACPDADGIALDRVLSADCTTHNQSTITPQLDVLED